MAFSYKVFIKIIAKEAGVSYSTVSKAIYNSPLISQDVRWINGLYTKRFGSEFTIHPAEFGRTGITTISDPFFVDGVNRVK